MPDLGITPEIAELAGAFAADGCLQKGYLCMWGNITEDREYYDSVLVPMYEKCFNLKLKPHEKRSNSVYGFYLCKKDVVKFFNEILGFPIGKKTYVARVPEIIRNSDSKEILAAFVRGFADCDGCVNFHKRYAKGYKEFSRKNNTYPRILLVSVSKDLVHDIADLMRRIGVEYNISETKAKYLNEADKHRIWVRGNTRVEKWLNLIGFSNPVHLSKIQVWRKFGYVPTNVKLQERYKLLKGEV